MNNRKNHKVEKDRVSQQTPDDGDVKWEKQQIRDAVVNWMWEYELDLLEVKLNIDSVK